MQKQSDAARVHDFAEDDLENSHLFGVCDLGCNGSQIRLWKRELQRFVDELANLIRASHFPIGTSKW